MVVCKVTCFLFISQGLEIVSLMLRHMPNEVFIELAKRGSVGLFTAEEETTIFPEYEHLADRPECKGEWGQWKLEVSDFINTILKHLCDTI